MKIDLLVGAAEFWPRLEKDLRGARRSAYVQTFTFEGDRAGRSLERAMVASRAADRRLLVDSYSWMYHSDRVLWGPAIMSKPVRREVALTKRFVRRMRGEGVDVIFGNPIARSPLAAVRRSHKKVACVDGAIAYLGGINFSDHNFAWHDMMLRIESRDLVTLLEADFRSSCSGIPQSYDETIGPLRIISANGRGNAARFEPVLEAIQGARTSIDVASAYLSHPFTDHLSTAAGRGVQVSVLTPRENNKANLARHVLERAYRGGLRVLRYEGGMNHTKAMVIDGDLLVAGSSNFDFMSYHILEEHVILTRHQPLVEAFRRRIWQPDAANAHRWEPRSTVGTRLGDLAVRAGAWLAACLARPAEGLA